MRLVKALNDMKIQLVTQTKMLAVKLTSIWMILLADIEVSTGAVSLVTEYGDNHLVASFCPGTIQLFCDGQDLPFLRWRSFSHAKKVDEFIILRDEMPTLIEGSAFLSVNFSIEDASPDSAHANFSSVLAVDLDRLQTQNVTNILCGSASVEADIPVNITIIAPSAPDKPNITNVTAVYQEGTLKCVEVEWTKLLICGSDLIYQVNLTGFQPIQVNHTKCELTYCSAKFAEKEQSELYEERALDLLARNKLNSSEKVFFGIPIRQQKENYFNYSVNNSECRTTVQCVTTQALYDIISCSIQYTTDPTYKKLNQFTSEDSSPFTGNTTYYFEFSVLIYPNLLIKGREKILLGSYRNASTRVKEIAFLAVTSFLILFFLIHITCIPLVLIKKGKNKNKIILFLLVVLIVIFILDVILLLTFIVNFIEKESCSKMHNILLDTMLIIACLGAFCLLLVWSSVCYRILHSQKLFGSTVETKDDQNIDHELNIENLLHSNQNKKESAESIIYQGSEKFDEPVSKNIYGELNESTLAQAYFNEHITRVETTSKPDHNVIFSHLGKIIPIQELTAVPGSCKDVQTTKTIASNENEVYDQLRPQEKAKK